VKFLFDFLPLILFFAAFKVAGIFVATAVAIAATVVQIVWLLARKKKVAGMQWTSLAIIVVFGGATLLLHDETFIKWKPTVLYWAGGAAFLLSLAFGRNLARSIMGADIELPQAIWTRLCVAWGAFFLFAGVLNLYIAFNFPTEFWVNFKVFGSLALIVAFVIAQSLWISRYLPDDDGKAAAGTRPPPKA
jgi:intracellular septation protein